MTTPAGIEGKTEQQPLYRFPVTWTNWNVALAHDWLTGMRGGEYVLEWLCEGFKDAPIYSLIHNPAKISEKINRHRVSTSWLQKFPGIERQYRYYLPLFPAAIESVAVAPGDLLISTSHCVAKGLKAPAGAAHLCYCFTPMRYAWAFYDEYFGENPIKKMLLSPVLQRLREWDRRTAAQVDRFVTLSRHVQSRIKMFYNRDADVVYPPVNIFFYTPGEYSGNEGFDLIVSALVPYKKIDLAVRAYKRLGYPLKIVGTGTEFEKLRKEAGPKTEFLGWLDNDQIRDLYRKCRCLVFPGEEDFGIVPVEAMACGKPVVAFGKGGALETVDAGCSGVFFEDQTEESLLAGIEECAGIKWDVKSIREKSELFGPQQFIDGMDRNIQLCLKQAVAGSI